jgi:hypothetical protein
MSQRFAEGEEDGAQVNGFISPSLLLSLQHLCVTLRNLCVSVVKIFSP